MIEREGSRPANDTGSPAGFVREIYRPYEARSTPADFSLRQGVPILSYRFRALVLKDRKQPGGGRGAASFSSADQTTSRRIISEAANRSASARPRVSPTT